MGNLETRAALAQAFRFLDALAGEGLGQQMEDGTTLFADKCCEDLERALGADFRAGWPDIAAHMIAPPAMDREAVARIVNPSAFTSRQSLYDYCISQGDTEEDARRIADDTHKPDCDKALAKADAILSTLSADAIRQGEDRYANDAAAKALYDSWWDQPGWVPWVDRGNSTMQERARREVML